RFSRDWSQTCALPISSARSDHDEPPLTPRPQDPTQGGRMQFNLADMFEGVADRLGDRTALVCGTERRSYAGLDARANRAAHHLRSEERRVGKDGRSRS